jgi:hypothetical protein
MGIPKAAVETYKAFKSGDLGTKEYRQSVSRNLVRSGLGLTGAVIITGMLSDDDFVGAYDPARYQIEGLRNSNYNAVRVGGKWISTDWLGPLSVPVTSMMYARKYASTPAEGAFQYGKGVLSSVKQLPGISDVYDFVKANAYTVNLSLEEMTSEAGNYIVDQLSSRLVPSIVSDVAKATDPKLRESKSSTDALKARIPGLRQTLPEKTDVFGETLKSESAITTILFGSRIKTDKETKTIKEISDLSTSLGKGINFTNWDKTSSKTLAQFKEKVGAEKYKDAKLAYGKELKINLDKITSSSKYAKATDEDKLKMINSLDSDAQEKILQRYHFKYKKQK